MLKQNANLVARVVRFFAAMIPQSQCEMIRHQTAKRESPSQI